ncbi:MAG TPA: bifunctional phosphopantothenoylcysteine decarboxylase/phosphopantothenate--cysteine ligase CoaBC [Flavisolibacter sp.]|nr:bifunctional phosphopantothenoylcysteine decarboxylase/phosphopantothenate--cysteine ligase CoaBC [Flavisolibacter sp.]
MLSGKKIILGITGSIAAYKSPLIVRQLIKKGAEVKVIMTPSSMDFVSNLTLSTLSKNPVLSDLFDDQSWANHVELGRWADLLVIAPLSCNTLAKMATGRCDNLLMAVYLSATCPVMAAPAMDEDMWHHATTKSNLNTIQQNGNIVLNVGYGELASGLTGEGRMAEPDEIVEYISNYFVNSRQLEGKNVLITAGPTREAIDPVRYISNHSSGKMGYALAEEMAIRGAMVYLISGHVSINTKHKNIKVDLVNSAEEMFNACSQKWPQMDIGIMAAAVADYQPASIASNKIKKSTETFELNLKKTKDILSSLGSVKKENQRLIGFALETDNEEANAIKKLKEKNADMIVLNSLNDKGAAFSVDTNIVTLFFKNGTSGKIELKSKSGIAKDIADALINIL